MIGEILGGLVARSAEKRQRRNQLSDQASQFTRLRDAAVAGGFNPLTALQATGGSGQGFVPGSGNEMTSGAFFAEAFARGADTFFNTPSKVDIEAETIKQQAQAYMLDRQAAAHNPYRNFGFALTRQGNALPARRVGVPAMASTRDKFSVANSVLPAPVLGGVPVPDSFLDRSSGAYVANRYFESAPGWMGAQQFEDAYGDVAGSVYGVAKFATDVGHNFGLYARRKYNAWRKPALSPAQIAWRKKHPNSMSVEISK